jgi:ribosome-binding protein aMBF1 (putative translation factor)
MSFPQQDWIPLTIHKRTTKSTDNTSVNKQSNGIKVKKIWDPKNPTAEPETVPVMITQELGQQIQKARTDRDLTLTQKQLANAICIPVSVISDYERGVGVYNSNYVNKIKNYLGINQ